MLSYNYLQLFLLVRSATVKRGSIKRQNKVKKSISEKRFLLMAIYLELKLQSVIVPQFGLLSTICHRFCASFSFKHEAIKCFVSKTINVEENVVQYGNYVANYESLQLDVAVFCSKRFNGRVRQGLLVKHNIYALFY